MAALVVAAAPATATIYDTIVPTYNYSPIGQCNEGQLGSAGVCQTDNANLTYFMSDGLEAADRIVVRDTVMAGMYDPTDLTVTKVTTPSYTGDAETDIIWQEGPVPGDDNGYTWCDDVATGWKCDQQYIRIEAGGSYQNSGLVCHEAGHAVGLVHGPSAWETTALNDAAMYCMRKPTPDGTPLGSRNVDNINDVY